MPVHGRTTVADRAMPSVVAPLSAVLCVLLCVCLAAPQAVAGSSDAQQGIQGFLDAHPDCAEFTDQCSFCRRDGDALICSTPTIACIKKAYVCTRKATD